MTSLHTPSAPATANDRFKNGFAAWFWMALLCATGAHFLLFTASPSFAIHDVSFDPEGTDLLALPDRIEIPPPPADVVRPAAPAFSDDPLVDTDLTIAPTTMDAHPPATLAPPPARGGDLSDHPVFTPTTLAPRLLNPGEVAAALERSYPPVLRDAGVGAVVRVWFFLDETGRVVKTQVHESSGYDAFDRAALDVAERMRFSPAENRDQRVPVWVSLPIRFEVR